MRNRVITFLGVLTTMLALPSVGMDPAAAGGGECELCVSDCDAVIDPEMACAFSGCGDIGACLASGSQCDWDIDDSDEQIICDERQD